MRLKLRQKVIILFFILAGEILAVVALGSFVLKKQNLVLVEYHEEMVELDVVKNLQIALLEVIMPVNDFLIPGGDPNEPDNFKALAAKVENLIATMDQLEFDNPQERELFNNIKERYSQIKKIAIQIFSISHPIGSIKAGRLMEKVDRVADDAVQIAERFHHIVSEELKQIQFNLQNIERLINQTFFGGIILNVLLILTGFIYAGRKIVSPIIALRDANLDIKLGNLEVKSDIKQKDEIGELAASFNDMVAEIKKSREELETLSITDHVTGLYNHRHFYKLLLSEFEKCRRYNYPIACIMFDVDNFKSINDIHGHEFGNLVLKEIGRLVSSELRSTDTIARYGGDEFLILLPHIERASALTLAEKIRKKMESHEFSKDSSRINVTVSIGISIFPEDHTTTPDDMIKNADVALYKAKRDGRNKTCI